MGARSLAVACAGLMLAVVPAMAFTGTAQAPAPDPSGVVRFVKHADSAYDRVTQRPDPATQAQIRRSFWRATVFTPYWHERSRWFADGWIYRDLYAIYRGSSVAREHPEWILRDRRGRPLSIPFGCDGRSCPQWAGDVSDPAFRRWWIAGVKQDLQGGRYRGIWIDDVNLDLRVSGPDERPVLPVGRSGRTMTEQQWREAVADFTAEVRAALPAAEIVHNAIWYAGGAEREGNPAVRKAMAAADWISVEHGVQDGGLTGGTGPFSLDRLLTYVDAVHRSGRSIVLGASAGPGREYALAAYLLVNGDRDGLSAEARPAGAESIASLEGLGPALGPRRTWQGLLRRDFARGRVLVNEPGAAPRTVVLGRGWRTLAGRAVSRITLGPAQGVTLRR